MPWPRSSWTLSFVILIVFVGPAPRTSAAQELEPIVHTVRVPEPGTHVAEVEARVPTTGRASIEMMMAVWTPGFYRTEDYAQRVRELSARTREGAMLAVEKTRKNRWRIDAAGTPTVVVSYRLSCEQRSVTTNWVGDDLAVFNGAATFLTPIEQVRRPHEIRLELPARWKRSMTALDPAPDGAPNHYRAEDFDTLADSPIVAGDPVVREFVVDGSEHSVADLGDVGPWDGERAARSLEMIVQENARFWGFLPFRRYVFLNVFRSGGGGLEHKNSALLTAGTGRGRRPEVNLRWLEFVSHEYFHAFNVKRLRPVELGPFDYENPPRTSSLWISEGLTTYYGDLIVARAGLGGQENFLASMSALIGRLQNSPGRLLQTLEQSSLGVWTTGTSGVGQDEAKTVSYYVKGPVVGFLLDARIRRATDGKKSLDDLMRLAYERYSRERGFTPEQFRATAEEVAGVDLEEWFRSAIGSTEELDYSEALAWFGLRFAAAEDPTKAWKLELGPDRSDVQKERLQDLLRPSRRR